MQRETIGAVVAGFGLGFTAAAAIFFLPSMMKKQKPTVLPPVLEEGKTVPSIKEQTLTVSIPQDFQQVKEDTVTVIGRTKPKSLIVITTVEEDLVLQADPTGNFEQQVPVLAGTQEIVITAYFPDGESETVKKTVFLLPEES